MRVKRKNDEYRDIEIGFNVSKNAEGSASVRIGDTLVYAGVKMDTGEPYPDSPDEGSLMVNAEFLPLSDDEFEPGRPGENAIEMSRVVDRGIRESHAIDMKKLCIESGEKIWMVMIDANTMDYDGNSQDASNLAAMAAIMTAKMPTYDPETDTVNYKERNEPLPYNTIPISCTFAKIGDELRLDPTKLEEEMADATLIVTLSSEGSVVAVQKSGPDAFSVEQVNEAVDIASKRGKELRSKLEEAVKSYLK